MDDAPDFGKEIDEIEAAESSYTPPTVTVDVEEVTENRLQIGRPSYAQVMAMVDKIEGRRTEPEESQPKQQLQAKPQPMFKTQPRPEPPAQPQPQPRQPSPEIKAQKQEIAAAKSSAAEKLKSMVGGAARDMEESLSAKQAQAQEENLVLPQLSLQDQLTDLEKIQEGISEKAFSDEQLEVIKEEVKALSANAARTDIKKLSTEQRQVAVMVNQRVKEIKAELNMR